MVRGLRKNKMMSMVNMADEEAGSEVEDDDDGGREI